MVVEVVAGVLLLVEGVEGVVAVVAVVGARTAGVEKGIEKGWKEEGADERRWFAKRGGVVGLGVVLMVIASLVVSIEEASFLVVTSLLLAGLVDLLSSLVPPSMVDGGLGS